MQSQGLTPPSQNSSSLSVRVLESRSEYTCCHIETADSMRRLAAICVDGKYYSFFRTTTDQSIAFKLAARLQQRGDTVILTKTPKGYTLWILEAEAHSTSVPTPPTAASPIDKIPKVLIAPSQYQYCRIRVPDLDKQLAAIAYDGRYYSLFKAIEDFQQVLPVIRRLNNRGDDVVITRTLKGYALWILEPDAALANS